VPASQSLTVLSYELDATSLPSGENATEATEFVESEAFPPIIPIFPAHLTVAMTTSGVDMHGSDSDSVLSESLGPRHLRGEIYGA
jgi:hypothetical protein